MSHNWKVVKISYNKWELKASLACEYFRSVINFNIETF